MSEADHNAMVRQPLSLSGTVHKTKAEALQNPETVDASQADEAHTHSEPAQTENMAETEEQSGPEFRAHVRIRRNPPMACLSTFQTALF